jgi:hypothetical protein
VLVFGERQISDDEYATWSVLHHRANCSLEDRGHALAKVAKEIEVDLNLVGVTAIEDKLQDNVPATIAAIQRSGIITWMLTGDKLETAINIALSCNLLKSDTLQVVIAGATKSESAVHRIIKTRRKDFQSLLHTKRNNLAIIVDGRCVAQVVMRTHAHRNQRNAHFRASPKRCALPADGSTLSIARAFIYVAWQRACTHFSRRERAKNVQGARGYCFGRRCVPRLADPKGSNRAVRQEGNPITDHSCDR